MFDPNVDYVLARDFIVNGVHHKKGTSGSEVFRLGTREALYARGVLVKPEEPVLIPSPDPARPARAHSDLVPSIDPARRPFTPPTNEEEKDEE